MILRINKSNKKCCIHRLVAEAFIPNPLSLPEIRHKDKDKTNNCVDNLEWCDHKANMNKHKRSHSIQIYCFDLNKYFSSASEASVHTGIARTNIVKACRGKYQQAGGKLWCYAKDKAEKFTHR